MPKEIDPKFTDKEKKRISDALIQLIAAQKVLDNWKKRVPLADEEIDKLVKGYQKLESGDKTLAEFNKLSTVSIRTIFNEVGIMQKYAKDYNDDPL